VYDTTKVPLKFKTLKLFFLNVEVPSDFFLFLPKNILTSPTEMRCWWRHLVRHLSEWSMQVLDVSLLKHYTSFVSSSHLIYTQQAEWLYKHTFSGHPTPQPS